MKTDWERLREKMLRPEVNKIIAKETYTAQDACDLKVLLKCMEMSHTNQMFDEQGVTTNTTARHTHMFDDHGRDENEMVKAQLQKALKDAMDSLH